MSSNARICSLILLLGDVGEDKEREHGEQQQQQGQPRRLAAGFGSIVFGGLNRRGREPLFRGLAIDAGSIALDEWPRRGRSNEAGYTSAEELACSAFLQRYCG